MECEVIWKFLNFIPFVFFFAVQINTAFFKMVHTARRY